MRFGVPQLLFDIGLKFRDSDTTCIASKIFFQRLPNNSGRDNPKRTRIWVFKHLDL